MVFQDCVALTILISYILSIWPYHPSLCALAKFIMFLWFIILSNYSYTLYNRNIFLNRRELMKHWMQPAVIFLVISFPPHGAASPSGLGPSNFEASRWHSVTSHSVELLWASDQPNTDTCTWKHVTITRERLACLRRDSNPKSQQASGSRRTP